MINSMREMAVGSVDDVDDLDILRVEPGGLPAIAIYRIGDQFFATDDTCSHGDASLADGFLCEDYSIECPYHSGRFDVRDGQPITLPCTTALQSYPVIIRDGVIYLGIGNDPEA